MYYNILVKYKNDSIAYLQHKDRMQWKLQTARKHLKQCITEQQNSDKWDDVRYFAMVLA